ncbi:uncharacterized protein LOC111946342 [Oryzias latipes]|uniref:uncharacterized protein LOC111946342 n=1 Tax=Oryzias latipes TaxID=8090 RepID=UPI000CE21D15|nr:uncharacterized protein LOC111946342 [Oryzias latipes]
MLQQLLLLLLVGNTLASHFYGTMMTYYPKETQVDGSVTVVVRFKTAYDSCQYSNSWICSGNCGSENVTAHEIQNVTNENWCQKEEIMTRVLPNNTGFTLRFSGGNWINNIRNGVVLWGAVTQVELRNRSDTGKANTSPQTTILPSVRVPSNCPRDYSLLAFDPDGDEVKCRYGNSPEECANCNTPSVLTLSPDCTLSFSPTSTSNEGPYAVQLVLEDFPKQNISLTQTNGSQELKTTNQVISKIPLQFVLRDYFWARKP